VRLQRLGAGFVAVQQQAEEAEIDQECAVSQHAPEVFGLGLAAEGELERLRFTAPAEQIGGIPDRQRADQKADDG